MNRFASTWKYAFGTAGALLLLAGGLGVLWFFAPRFLPDPMERIRQKTPVHTWRDRNGKIFYQERTFDYEWRFPVPLQSISPETIQIMLAAEDAGFYRHHGVDYRAVFRAFTQNLAAGKIISGASTISMQLAGSADPKKKRTYPGKILQALAARRLEQLHSKEEILEEYLNRIPCGGKIYGIESAALYYFGRHASELNRAESTLICGLPQKPSKFRPDRHPDAAKERQRILLKLLLRRNLIRPEEAEKIRREPLRFRDFREKSSFERQKNPGENQSYIQMRKAAVPRNDIPKRCSIDLEIQNRILNILRRRTAALPDVSDAAAVLLRTGTGEVLALIGTLDVRNPKDGQVNAANGIRSAGSSLKPFLYAEAIAGGKIVAQTRLSDTPVRYAEYAPGNYDGTTRGTVLAEEALSLSLNTTAVRLVAELGEERVTRLLQRLRIFHDNGKPNGLALALGSAGHTLFELTRAYAVLAGNGIDREVSFHADEAGEKTVRVFPPGVCEMIASMLRKRPLPDGPPGVAWKTGTSNNNHDAWCFAYTPEYTLGVWFGNKDSRRSEALIGIDAAAPAAGEIFTGLHRNGAGTSFSFIHLTDRLLCRKSGKSPTPDCMDLESASGIPGIPLVHCTVCGNRRREPVRILEPAAEEYLLRNQKILRLPVRANRKNLHYFLNGISLGTDPAVISVGIGRHTLTASGASVGETAGITLIVRNAEAGSIGCEP